MNSKDQGMFKKRVTKGVALGLCTIMAAQYVPFVSAKECNEKKPASTVSVSVSKSEKGFFDSVWKSVKNFFCNYPVRASVCTSTGIIVSAALTVLLTKKSSGGRNVVPSGPQLIEDNQNHNEEEETRELPVPLDNVEIPVLVNNQEENYDGDNGNQNRHILDNSRYRTFSNKDSQIIDKLYRSDDTNEPNMETQYTMKSPYIPYHSLNAGQKGSDSIMKVPGLDIHGEDSNILYEYTSKNGLKIEASTNLPKKNDMNVPLGICESYSMEKAVNSVMNKDAASGIVGQSLFSPVAFPR